MDEINMDIFQSLPYEENKIFTSFLFTFSRRRSYPTFFWCYQYWVWPPHTFFPVISWLYSFLCLSFSQSHSRSQRSCSTSPSLFFWIKRDVTHLSHYHGLYPHYLVRKWAKLNREKLSFSSPSSSKPRSSLCTIIQMSNFEQIQCGKRAVLDSMDILNRNQPCFRRFEDFAPKWQTNYERRQVLKFIKPDLEVFGELRLPSPVVACNVSHTQREGDSSTRKAAHSNRVKHSVLLH